MSVKYYYLRDKKNVPRVTRCILKNSYGEVGVGSAICSYSDHPNKKAGRRIAFQRAVYALKSKKHVLPIKRYIAHDVIIDVKADLLDYTDLSKFERDFKGLYADSPKSKYLNKFEKQLVA